MDNKKIFDVSPPKTAQSIEAAKNARKIMLSEPSLKQDNSANPDIEEKDKILPEKELVPHQELTVEPLTDEAKDVEDTAPEVAKAVVKNSDIAKGSSENSSTKELGSVAQIEEKSSELSVEVVKAPEESVQAEEPEEEKQEPIKELASFDSIIPDDSQRATATAKDAMQSPTMYDTKAYYVPIGNSKHKHGHVLGTVVAGLIVAALVIGGVIAAGKFL